MRPILCPLAPVKEIFITDWSQMTNRVARQAKSEEALYFQSCMMCNTNKNYRIIIVKS